MLQTSILKCTNSKFIWKCGLSPLP